MRKCRRHITIVNNEIDYEKLAEAIAQSNVTKNNRVLPEAEEQPHQMSIGKLIVSVIFNRWESNGRLTSGLFGGILSVFFNTLAIIGALVLVAGIAGIVKMISAFSWTPSAIMGNIVAIAIMLLLLGMTALFAFVLRAAANEMSRETDRDYIMAVFSGIVSFAALVVALVALLKGVG